MALHLITDEEEADNEDIDTRIRRVVIETLVSHLPAMQDLPADHHIRQFIWMNDRLQDIRQTLVRGSRSKRRRKRLLRGPCVRHIDAMMKQNLVHLEALGVRPMDALEYVDYAVHVPLQVVPTSRPEYNGRIRCVDRMGYIKDDGRILRSALVTVMKFQPPTIKEQ